MLPPELVLHHAHHFFDGGVQVGGLALRLLAPGKFQQIGHNTLTIEGMLLDGGRILETLRNIG